jgi:hypothetical protein
MVRRGGARLLVRACEATATEGKALARPFWPLLVGLALDLCLGVSWSLEATRLPRTGKFPGRPGRLYPILSHQ